MEDEGLEAEEHQPRERVGLCAAVGGGDPEHDAEENVGHGDSHPRLRQREARGLAGLDPLPRKVDKVKEIGERGVGVVETAQGSFGERTVARRGQLRFVSSPSRATGNKHAPVLLFLGNIYKGD
jgi:hypothetical protein